MNNPDFNGVLSKYFVTRTKFDIMYVIKICVRPENFYLGTLLLRKFIDNAQLAPDLHLNIRNDIPDNTDITIEI